MTRFRGLIWPIAASAVWMIVAGIVPAALALTDGDTFVCQLGGGNGIVLTFRLSQQADTFALTGAWDDASLSPLLPVYGAVLEDPNFGIVGGLTYVGFAGRPLSRSPFGALPRGVHVQFRLRPGEFREEPALTGRWADDRGAHGPMSCNPPAP